MRIVHLLLIGISVSLATALSRADDTPTTRPKSTSTNGKLAATTEDTKPPLKPLKTVAATSTRGTKAPKSTAAGATSASDKRGKRTLYDFENAGFLYPEIASRRAGYEQDGRGYYPESGYYNGQNAIAQFPTSYAGTQYSPYPQYLEAPEPIIEIIIKDSNETLPTAPPQPVVTKKKKEKVHVFYVNYKKDENNKLHLESPIASLNNDDAEEEEEEIVHYPVVTPQPPVKATTLRTIIHPDSEKYHSNSGIHVTFGSEDKSQSGHILEEHDAESIQRQVVALPVDSTLSGTNFKNDVYNTRADFGSAGPQGRSPPANQLFTGPFQQALHSASAPHALQQLPSQHASNYFRPPGPLPQNPAPPSFYQKFQQQLQPQSQQQQPQQQQQQQRPQYSLSFNGPPNTPQPQAQALYRKPSPPPQPPPQSHFYVNQNQQYQHQSTVQHNQFYHGLSQKQTQPPKPQSVFFPTPPPKVQELPARQSPAPYQPVKFRPTPVPSPHVKPVPVPIPAKLENTKYQTLSQSQQQHQPQPQQQQQQQRYQPPQLHYQSQPQLPAQSPYQFNRQPQYVQQPSFSVVSPTHLPNYFKPLPQSQSQSQSQPQPHSHAQSNGQSNAQASSLYLSQKLASSRYQTQPQTQSHPAPTPQSSAHQAPTVAAALQSSSGLSALHNYFGVQPSKETELLKSIPKFEQHITETIHNHAGQTEQHSGQFGHFGYSNQNQVIHDIPAPNLGPTPSSADQQQQQQSSHSQSNYASAGSSGHFITASHLNSQQSQQQQQQQQPQQQQQQTFTNFVTTSHSNGIGTHRYPTTTSPTPPQFAESTDGQKIMIVTPMPATVYNQYQSGQYAHHGANSQPQPLQAQASTNFAQQPRQASSAQASSISGGGSSINSQFSVSTYHSDVFKELEQRKHEQKQPSQTINQFSFGTRPHNADTQSPYLPATASTQTPSAVPTPAPQQQQHQQQQQQQKSDSAATNSKKASQSLLQLPAEVPDDLRQQLLSSGILNNADISVLDYDKVGDVALENLPAEHLQHFYGAGGGAQISESNRVLTVVKTNGDKVSLSEKDIERVKQSNALPHKQGVDVKVVRFDAHSEKSVTDKFVKADATVVPAVELTDRQYNRYLPLKINGAQFPIPESEELQGKKVVSVVVLAPVEAQSAGTSAERANEQRSERDATNIEGKEVKFLGGELIKTLVKKPTKENFKRWLEKEARTDLEMQSVVLLVTKASDDAEQEIFMYDITTGLVNKLNGELSSAFVSVAEENASSEDLEHASTLDPSVLETMMHKSRR